MKTGALRQSGPIASVVIPTAVALAIRVHELLHGSIWADELQVVAAAKQGAARAIQMAAADVYPPLYYILAALYNPSDPHQLRWISAVTGTLTVTFVAGLGLRLGGAVSALVGGLWLALLPAHVHWSQEARAYSLLGLLVVALTGNVLVRGNKVVTALLAAAMLYTHGLAPIYLVPVVGLGVWTRDWRQLTAVGAGALAFLPWVGLGIFQAERYRGFSDETLTSGGFLSRSMAYLGSGHIDTVWALWTGVPTLLLLAILAARDKGPRKLLLGVGLAFVALAAVAPFIGGLMGKHAVPLAANVAVALGWGAKGLAARTRFLLVLIAFAAPVAGLVHGAAQDPVRFDVRSVVAAVADARLGGPLASNTPDLVRLYLPSAVLGVPLDDATAMGEVYHWQRRVFAGRARSVWWIVEEAHPDLLGQLRGAFPVVWASEQRGALGVAVALEEGVALAPNAAVLDRVSLEHEGGTLAFYQAGSARMISNVDGTLALWMTGSHPQSELSVRIAGADTPRDWRCAASPLLTRHVVGHVNAGDSVELRFTDPPNTDGTDTNVWVFRVEVGGAGEGENGCEDGTRRSPE